MDALLEVWIPRLVPSSGLRAAQKSIHWLGQDQPLEPLQYAWGAHLLFRNSPLTPHLLRFLPANYTDPAWMALTLEHKSLEKSSYELSGVEPFVQGEGLEAGLRVILSSVPRWVLIYALHCDKIDRACPEKLDDALSFLKENIVLRDAGAGFLAWA